MSQTSTEELVLSLRPNFSEHDLQRMRLYYEVSLKYNEELNRHLIEMLKEHTVFGPLIRMQTPEIQRQRNEMTLRLTNDALYKGKWDEYTADLIQQGMTYARLGMSFKSWYEVVSLVKDSIVPYIIEEFKSDYTKIHDAIIGLGKLTDFAMQAIAESYFMTEKSIIQGHQKKQDALIKDLQSFAYVVSHDLKSPLRGIAKISEWLAQDYTDVLDEHGKKQLGLLKKRVVRLDHLIDGILAYSRSGDENEPKTEVNVENLLQETIDLTVVDNNVEVNVVSPMPIIIFDRPKLVQVFSNLIGNAIKHNDKAKTVVTIGCQDIGEDYEFSVADNGPGIDEKYQQKIFRIFQTLQTKDETESTGIGLSIVKKIIESADGSIQVESAVGNGAKFIFTLPKN